MKIEVYCEHNFTKKIDILEADADQIQEYLYESSLNQTTELIMELIKELKGKEEKIRRLNKANELLTPKLFKEEVA